MPDRFGNRLLRGLEPDQRLQSTLANALEVLNVELVQDVALAPVPLSHASARDLLRRLKGARLLNGYRGRAASDVDALVEAMVRLGQLAQDCNDEIGEIDLNPIILHPEGQGISVVDALAVKVRPAAARSG